MWYRCHFSRSGGSGESQRLIKTPSYSSTITKAELRIFVCRNPGHPFAEPWVFCLGSSWSKIIMVSVSFISFMVFVPVCVCFRKWRYAHYVVNCNLKVLYVVTMWTKSKRKWCIGRTDQALRLVLSIAVACCTFSTEPGQSSCQSSWSKNITDSCEWMMSVSVLPIPEFSCSSSSLQKTDICACDCDVTVVEFNRWSSHIGFVWAAIWN
jgi:hypothetical protein